MLADGDADNKARRFERETAHLPGAMDEAIPFYRGLFAAHHAAMMEADVDEVMALREEAHKLALRLNNGAPGIIAGEDAPGCVLESKTAADPGSVPLWGQAATFEITVRGMPVRIELDGMFGIGAPCVYWPGFAAHAVDYDAPFVSETGYRSFLGIHADPVPDLTPDAFAARIIEAHIDNGLKGRLEEIAERYRRCNN
ncbi:hypothetical protein C2I36_13030 [Rhodobacteraceae bacterium WD3A24]|nr:hypothetical protein C2I36_13030 [Rhodobacteraceae bacterium WD3A24]